MTKDLVGLPHRRGRGENLHEGVHHYDGTNGDEERNKATDDVIIPHVLVITPEADHETATGDGREIMMTGIATTHGEVLVPMIGTVGGPHEGPLRHPVDQRTITGGVRQYIILDVQCPLLGIGGLPLEGGRMAGPLQDAHPHGMTTGRGRSLDAVAAATAEPGAVLPVHPPLKLEFQTFN